MSAIESGQSLTQFIAENPGDWEQYLLEGAVEPGELYFERDDLNQSNIRAILTSTGEPVIGQMDYEAVEINGKGLVFRGLQSSKRSIPVHPALASAIDFSQIKRPENERENKPIAILAVEQSIGLAVCAMILANFNRQQISTAVGSLAGKNSGESREKISINPASVGREASQFQERIKQYYRKEIAGYSELEELINDLVRNYNLEEFEPTAIETKVRPYIQLRSIQDGNGHFLLNLTEDFGQIVEFNGDLPKVLMSEKPEIQTASFDQTSYRSRRIKP